MLLLTEISVLKRCHVTPLPFRRIAVTRKVQCSVYRESPHFITNPNTNIHRLLASSIDADVNLSFQRLVLKTKRDHVSVVIMPQMRTVHREQLVITDKNNSDTSRSNAFSFKHTRDSVGNRCAHQPCSRMRIDDLYMVP